MRNSVEAQAIIRVIVNAIVLKRTSYGKALDIEMYDRVSNHNLLDPVLTLIGLTAKDEPKQSEMEERVYVRFDEYCKEDGEPEDIATRFYLEISTMVFAFNLENTVRTKGFSINKLFREARKRAKKSSLKPVTC